MRTRLPTWAFEAAVAFGVLALSALLTGGGALSWVSALAVWFSFLHGTVTDRLAEGEGRRSTPDVRCYGYAVRYFVAKELLWAVVFVGSGLYPALVGSVLFLAYPAWRRLYRRYWPLQSVSGRGSQRGCSQDNGRTVVTVTNEDGLASEYILEASGHLSLCSRFSRSATVCPLCGPLFAREIRRRRVLPNTS